MEKNNGKMKKTILFTLLILQSAISFAQSSKKDFKALLKTIGGVYEAPTTSKDADVKTISITPINGSAIGDDVFFVKYTKTDGSIYRQRVMVFQFENDKILSESMSFLSDSTFRDLDRNVEKAKNLKIFDLKPSLGCKENWQKVGDEFIAQINDCPFKSARRNSNILISSRMMVSKTGMATTEQGKDESGKVLFGSLNGYALKLNRK
jgi:hypothetical protein